MDTKKIGQNFFRKNAFYLDFPLCHYELENKSEEEKIACATVIKISNKRNGFPYAIICSPFIFLVTQNF
jgi:hypothetical protein